MNMPPLHHCVALERGRETVREIALHFPPDWPLACGIDLQLLERREP
jgi:hypothetical protein